MASKEQDTSAIQLGITSAAISGDAGTVYRIAAKLMDEGVAFDSLLFDYLLPAERAVGHRWEHGDYLISEEHAATATIETVVSLLVGMFDQPEDAAHVVIAAAQGDDHSLPGRAISAYLLFSGYRTTFLGANVLATDLAEFLEAEGPDVLVISCSMSSHLMGAHASIEAAKDAGVPVVVGGRAFGHDDTRARSLGADAWSDSIGEVIGEVESLLSGGSTARSAAELSPELEALSADEIDVIAVAHRRIMEQVDETRDRRWLDEVSILLGSIQGAMLIGDDEVLIETLRWQRAIMSTHGYRADLVADSLHSALEERSPSAAAVLGRNLQSD